MTPDWPQGQYGAILVDPPWPFVAWSPKGQGRSGEAHYRTMSHADLEALPVRELAAPNCVLFIWIVQTQIPQAVRLIEAWGFTMKSCAFAWIKGDGLPLFPDDVTTQIGMGKWTRAEFEQCWLATRGSPKRLDAGVRQVLIEKRREHSRKPDGIHERIERLVAGPYLELWARQSTRPGWSFWGLEKEKFNAVPKPKRTWKNKIRSIRIENDVAFVPLTRGLEAIIDAADVPLVEGWNWCALPATDGDLRYAYSGGNRQLRLHQLLLPAPVGFMVDHCDGNGLNCRRENLRLATARQNKQHQRKRKDGISQFKGVSPHGPNWRARIVIDGRRIGLGTFKSEQAAALAYDRAASAAWGEFAILNFPNREQDHAMQVGGAAS